MVVEVCSMDDSVCCVVIQNYKETHHFTGEIIIWPHWICFLDWCSLQLPISNWTITQSYHCPPDLWFGWHQKVIPFQMYSTWIWKSSFSKKDCLFLLEHCIHAKRTEFRCTLSCKYFFPIHVGTHNPLLLNAIWKEGELGKAENTLSTLSMLSTTCERNSDCLAFLIKTVSNRCFKTWDTNNDQLFCAWSAGCVAVSMRLCSVGELS